MDKKKPLKKWTEQEEIELDYLYSSLHWRVAEVAKRFGGAGREMEIGE